MHCKCIVIYFEFSRLLAEASLRLAAHVFREAVHNIFKRKNESIDQNRLINGKIGYKKSIENRSKESKESAEEIPERRAAE